MNNGSRFETYAIEEPKNSGTIALYGPATYLGEIGDPIIIISYSMVEEKETRSVSSKVISVDSNNKAIKKK